MGNNPIERSTKRAEPKIGSRIEKMMEGILLGLGERKEVSSVLRKTSEDIALVYCSWSHMDRLVRDLTRPLHLRESPRRPLLNYFQRRYLRMTSQ